MLNKVSVEGLGRERANLALKHNLLHFGTHWLSCKKRNFLFTFDSEGENSLLLLKTELTQGINEYFVCSYKYALLKTDLFLTVYTVYII